MAVSTGLLAGMMLPAHAITGSAGADGVSSDTPAVDGLIIDLLGVGRTPSTDGPLFAPEAAPEAAPAVAAPAVAAPTFGPTVSAPATVAALPAFGSLGFKTVNAPAPVATQVSRSAAGRTSPAPAPAPVAGGSVLSVAASLLGIPYRYGGSSPSTGFDCSGYTSYVYKLARGIVLPRSAEAQRRSASKVANPVPGDLVFFGIPATHVGIYAGNGMMYHSPRTGSVSNLSKIYSSNVTYGRY